MTPAPSTAQSTDPPADGAGRPVLLEAGRPTDPGKLLRAALASPHVAIPPRFFYDDLGSRLFAAITALEEYYPTRTEQALLAAHLPEIAGATPVSGCTLVDLGAGNCEKAASLFPTLQPACYVAVDISADYLLGSLDHLRRRFPAVRMMGVATDFAEHLDLPAAVPAARRLFFYPGSSIGNFTPDEAVGFLGSIRRQMRGDGVLWIGVDLQKPTRVLERAYDDPLGITAAFNRNLLRHVNRLLGADFVLEDWRHVAFYDERLGRIEMHLEAVRDVNVRWPGGQRRFRAGERIHTENSYKHTVPGFTALLAQSGMRSLGCWTDPQGWFGFFVATPAEGA